VIILSLPRYPRVFTPLYLCNVDDLLITGDDTQSIIQLKTTVHEAFTIKDLGLAR